MIVRSLILGTLSKLPSLTRHMCRLAGFHMLASHAVTAGASRSSDLPLRAIETFLPLNCIATLNTDDDAPTISTDDGAKSGQRCRRGRQKR
jgi:hypothetical protein